MKNDPRKLAMDIFCAWEKSNHTLDLCMDKASSKLDRLSEKDRRFLNALVFGVFRRRETLDWIISKQAHAPMLKIKMPIRYLLRSAVFQLFFMDKVPVFAAIDTAVTLSKRVGGKKTGGFVNAVLRKISTDTKWPASIDNGKDAAKDLSIKFAVPKWLAQKWVAQYGIKSAENLCRHTLEIADIHLRVNTLKANRAALIKALEPQVNSLFQTLYSDDGIRLSGPNLPIHQLPGYEKGWFQVQDESAQIVTHILSPVSGERILDACAGLGGKTHHIAQMMQDKGEIIAVDIEPSKLTALQKESQRLGVSIIETRALDILKSTVKDFSGFFDRVLLDAPCSGLGVLRRNPDTKWRRTFKDIQRMAARQKKMLNAAANLVKPGGILVYAVCSCENEENEAVIQAFLSKRKDFSIDKPAGFDRLTQLKTGGHFYKTYPDSPKMDGFFIARLIRASKTP